jgi:inhibitor of KinA sporulation pathway (predicted exonuclease)
MKKEDVRKAVSFQLGIQKFSNWLGEDYFLCTWGKDDKLHLINQCVRNKINLDWLRNYNDIQQQIGKILVEDNKNQLGLKGALDLAGITPVGKAHRGIDDAINTAELLINFIERVNLQNNSLSDKELSQHSLKFKKSKFQPNQRK